VRVYTFQKLGDDICIKADVVSYYGRKCYFVFVISK